jgi:glycosyltransferase involved in cell wall biosynthesis
MAEIPAIVAPRTGAVVVVVPAHNEEDLIGACLDGIGRAAEHPDLAGVAVHLVVVLDDCRDATAARAAEAAARPAEGAPRPGALRATSLVAVSVRNVGRARALGATHAFLALGLVDPEEVWLASTDADSVVPPDWLAHHLALRRGGADACAGTVVVESWRDHPATAQPAFDAHYQPDGLLAFGHPHVHGTNLGVSMAAYLAAGGFSPLVSGEDHALWLALAGTGRRLVATPLAPVTTSGRRHGRSPAGFAATLRRLAG